MECVLSRLMEVNVFMYKTYNNKKHHLYWNIRVLCLRWVHAFAGIVYDFIKGLIIKWIHGKPCFGYSHLTKIWEEGSKQTNNMNYFHGKIEIKSLRLRHISISYLAMREEKGSQLASSSLRLTILRPVYHSRRKVHQTALYSDLNHISLFIFIAIGKTKGRSFLRDLVSYYTSTSHLINFQFLLLFAWMSSFAQCEIHCKRWGGGYTVCR